MITAATPDLPSKDIAALIWSTDPVLMDYMFGDPAVFEKVVAEEWSSAEGLLSHGQGMVATEGDQLLGLCVGHTEDEYETNFEASQHVQTRALSPDQGAHLQRALMWMNRLFPDPRAGSFYVLELAVAPDARGKGLGRALLQAAVRRARDRGCARLALDVAADNPVVAFYERIGLQIEIETRVPHLTRAFGVGPHLHMSAALHELEGLG